MQTNKEKKEFSLKRYDNLDEVILAVYQDDENSLTLEDLKESIITGLDSNEQEVSFDYETQKAGIETQGVWGWIDKDKVIHYWLGKDLPIEELIHFLAHEIGHETGEPNEDHLQEEMRAEDFGYVATQAYEFAKQLKSQFNEQVGIKS